MKTIKICIHSVIDVITNSSTEIFIYSEGCESALLEMINEFFKSFNINKTFDEVFNTVILCDYYHYSDYILDLDEEDLPEGITKETNIDKLYEDVANGIIKKPNWFTDVEQYGADYGEYTPATFIHIIPKEKQYEKLAELIKKFLYSTNHEAS